MTAPMQGIRVLEVAEHTFVPAASAILSDWGAEVIKVEPVERGDAMRGLMSAGGLNMGGPGYHPLLEHSNRGKRSIGLDLSQPEGVEVLLQIAATCDVFLTNKLPAVRKKLKIDVEDIRAVNPSIVYVRGSGYGSRGPDADSGGYDVLGYWCRSGVAAAAKPLEIDHMTAQPAPAYGDSIGAMTIAGGIAAGLLHKERTGDGTVIDVSLLATGMWSMGAAVALSQFLGSPWGQMPADTDIGNPLTSSYLCDDDRWVFLSCLQGFHYWSDLCRVLDRPELVSDERFADVDAFRTNAMAAKGILTDVFRAAPLAHWQDVLRAFKGQWSFVQDCLQVVDDEQVRANGYMIESETKAGEKFELVATPVQFDEAPSPTRRAPEFNEDGDQILGEDLGLGMDAILDLKLKGVVA